MRPHRTWLFVPAHREERIRRALYSPAQAVILDLDDAVPLDRKVEARTVVASVKLYNLNCFVRIRRGKELDGDLLAAVRRGIRGVVLPACEEPEALLEVERRVSERERATGLPAGSVRLVAIVESAAGVVRAAGLAAGCARLEALIFGAEDYAHSMGLPPGPPDEMLYARSAVAVAAASQGLQAVDRVWTDLSDPAGLEADARRARSLGFTGKAAIHPAQLEAIHAAFRPTEAELARARRIWEAWKAAGEGVTVVDGRMVDAPVALRARAVMEEADDLG